MCNIKEQNDKRDLFYWIDRVPGKWYHWVIASAVLLIYDFVVLYIW